MTRSARVLARSLILTLVLALPCRAEPLPPPTVEEGVRNAKRILLAEYFDCLSGPKDQEKVTYADPPSVRYRVIKVLKGEHTAEVVGLTYFFGESRESPQPPNFRWSPNMMPVRGTRTYLVFDESGNTYRGSFGRLPATEENKQKIEQLLGKFH